MPNKMLVGDLKVGMMFSEPLLTDDMTVILPAGVPIKEADYNRMVRWGIKEVFTEGQLIDEVSELDRDDLVLKFFENHVNDGANEQERDYRKIYNLCISLYEEFLDSLKSSEKLDKDKLRIIVEKVIFLVDNYKNQIISFMAQENEEYDYNTTHVINTAIIALIGGKELNLKDDLINHLVMAALLHDLGMLRVPAEILNKKEKLTDGEYSKIKSHPIVAFKQLNRSNNFNQIVMDAVLQHHEQFNGNGYPRKLGGKNINVLARILAVSDTFEAQITYRSYRKSKTGYVAMKSVLAEASNKFDPQVLRAFLTAFSIYPPGTLVQMNDNSIGTVVSINSDAPLRPHIKTIVDKFGDLLAEKPVKDLRNEEDLFIVRVLDKEEYRKQ